MISIYDARSAQFDTGVEDPFLRIPYRFIGHSYALGYALQYNFSPKTLDICSTVACAYYLWHATYRVFQQRQYSIRMSTLFDPIIFDWLASAMIPTYLINNVCNMAVIALREYPDLPSLVIEWGPLTMGLVSLLYSYDTIDQYVNRFMNETIRKFY